MTTSTGSSWLNSWVPRAVLVAVIAATSLASAGRASRKLLWHDEVLTVAILQQPFDQLGPMLRRGIDLTPPLFHVITEAGLYVPVTEALGVRLMSIVAFAICLVGLDLFVAYRATHWHGVAAVMVAAASGAHVFAYEARSYALLLAFNALAFVCWQRATDDAVAPGRRTALVLLACCIAGAVSSHYYGALVPLPFAVAELVRLARRRRPDWPLLIALLAGGAPLLAFRDFMRAGTEQAAYFFSPPDWRVTVEAYERYGSPLVIPTLVAIAAGVAVIVARPRLGRIAPGAVPAQSSVTPPHEWIACVALLLLPPIALVLATITGTGYVARYTLTWTLGLALSAGLLARHLGSTVLIAGVLSFGLWIGLRETQGARHVLLPPVDVQATFAALHRVPVGEDIAVAHPHLFTQLQYYLAPALGERVVFVQRPGAVVGGDTGAIAIRELSRWRPMAITDLNGLALRRHFFLYTPHDWIIEELTRVGADLRLRGVDLAETPFAVSRLGVLWLYEVQMPPH